ncbi:P-loop containing nucleoside triphosphate hydrolase protein [Amylocarpus encephaloides]|uniref:Origin recognition complex subunit 1 n=1 Tax=Amylocarpus encephaloides TaxID=45428 RepID=A0A9P7YT55_9HELO|nr:P-loop containing nucleoside triphosphate hydrolase protein [Amylocarpus encephaloides]
MTPNSTRRPARQRRPIQKAESANMIAQAAKDTSEDEDVRGIETEEEAEDDDEDDEEEQDSEEDDGDFEWIYERKLDNGKLVETRNSMESHNEKIIGCKRLSDGLEFRVGDCVMITASGSKKWVAMIVNFIGQDKSGDESATLLWFVDQDDVLNKKKNRSDYLPQELYITSDTDVNPLASIIEKATILSYKDHKVRFPVAKVGRHAPKDYKTTFFCRRGVFLRSAIYTDWEIAWDKFSHQTESQIMKMKEKIDAENEIKESKQPAERRKRKEKYEEEVDYDKEVEDDGAFGTPRKKQKVTKISTPRKPRTPSKLLTPSQRKVIVKKPLEFTPLGTRMLDPDHVQSPFQKARSRLHVSSVPANLPCREDEFGSVYSHLEAAIIEGTGACIYISGTPGTGKTATVREVVAQLNASVMENELDDFIFVEINGMKVVDPHQSYSLLWEALKGDRVSPSHALDLLEREFNHPSPRRTPCVVLMDELDQLVTKNQSVMYNFFNWPGLRHSKLIVLAVANTMDLPERTLSNKISSRLGLTRITFPGYTHDQLMKIIQSRLEGVLGDIVEPDAIQFASRKVAAVSGDARRCLDICRRAVELAESDSLSAAPHTPSKSGRGQQVSKSIGKVTIATVKRAINEATTSPLQQCLRCLPLASKVFLAALLARTRRTGIAESVLGDVLDEARRMARMDTVGNTAGYLLKDEARTTTSIPICNPQSAGKAARLLAMGLSAIDLMEAGIIGLENRKADRTGKIRLSIGEEDLKLAFKDDPEIKSLGFSV